MSSERSGSRRRETSTESDGDGDHSSSSSSVEPDDPVDIDFIIKDKCRSLQSLRTAVVNSPEVFAFSMLKTMESCRTVLADLYVSTPRKARVAATLYTSLVALRAFGQHINRTTGNLALRTVLTNISRFRSKEDPVTLEKLNESLAGMDFFATFSKVLDLIAALCFRIEDVSDGLSNDNFDGRRSYTPRLAFTPLGTPPDGSSDGDSDADSDGDEQPPESPPPRRRRLVAARRLSGNADRRDFGNYHDDQDYDNYGFDDAKDRGIDVYVDDENQQGPQVFSNRRNIQAFMAERRRRRERSDSAAPKRCRMTDEAEGMEDIDPQEDGHHVEVDEPNPDLGDLWPSFDVYEQYSESLITTDDRIEDENSIGSFVVHNPEEGAESVAHIEAEVAVTIAELLDYLDLERFDERAVSGEESTHAPVQMLSPSPELPFVKSVVSKGQAESFEDESFDWTLFDKEDDEYLKMPVPVPVPLQELRPSVQLPFTSLRGHVLQVTETAGASGTVGYSGSVVTHSSVEAIEQQNSIDVTEQQQVQQNYDDNLVPQTAHAGADLQDESIALGSPDNVKVVSTSEELIARENEETSRIVESPTLADAPTVVNVNFPPALLDNLSTERQQYNAGIDIPETGGDQQVVNSDTELDLGERGESLFAPNLHFSPHRPAQVLSPTRSDAASVNVPSAVLDNLPAELAADVRANVVLSERIVAREAQENEINEIVVIEVVLNDIQVRRSVGTQVEASPERSEEGDVVGSVVANVAMITVTEGADDQEENEPLELEDVVQLEEDGPENVIPNIVLSPLRTAQARVDVNRLQTPPLESFEEYTERLLSESERRLELGEGGAEAETGSQAAEAEENHTQSDEGEAKMSRRKRRSSRGYSRVTKRRRTEDVTSHPADVNLEADDDWHMVTDPFISPKSTNSTIGSLGFTRRLSLEERQQRDSSELSASASASQRSRNAHIRSASPRTVEMLSSQSTSEGAHTTDMRSESRSPQTTEMLSSQSTIDSEEMRGSQELEAEEVQLMELSFEDPDEMEQ